MDFTKYIKRQDSGWKQTFGYSGETSINLSMEISEFLTYGLVTSGEESCIIFRIHKEDFLNALDFIISQCPLYRTTSRTCELVESNNIIFEKMRVALERFFGNSQETEYGVTIYCRKDGRIYLKGLKQKGFSIRDFLVENSSALRFIQNDALFDLRLISSAFEQ